MAMRGGANCSNNSSGMSCFLRMANPFRWLVIYAQDMKRTSLIEPQKTISFLVDSEFL